LSPCTTYLVRYYYSYKLLFNYIDSHVRGWGVGAGLRRHGNSVWSVISGSTVCRGWSRWIRTSRGVVVGLIVRPVQAWKKERYKLFDWLIWSSLGYLNHMILSRLSQPMGAGTGGLVPTLEMIWVGIAHPEFSIFWKYFGWGLPTIDFVQKHYCIIIIKRFSV